MEIQNNRGSSKKFSVIRASLNLDQEASFDRLGIRLRHPSMLFTAHSTGFNALTLEGDKVRFDILMVSVRSISRSPFVPISGASFLLPALELLIAAPFQQGPGSQRERCSGDDVVSAGSRGCTRAPEFFGHSGGRNVAR